MSRQVYKYCKVQKCVVPIEEVIQQERTGTIIINDEMPATRHPIDGHYYTSKTKFRAVTRANGCEEIGNEYDRGYEPGEMERQALSRENTQRIKEELRQRLNGIKHK